MLELGSSQIILLAVIYFALYSIVTLQCTGNTILYPALGPTIIGAILCLFLGGLDYMVLSLLGMVGVVFVPTKGDGGEWRMFGDDLY